VPCSLPGLGMDWITQAGAVPASAIAGAAIPPVSATTPATARNRPNRTDGTEWMREWPLRLEESIKNIRFTQVSEIDLAFISKYNGL
jgi:hypothetical protein